MSSPSSRRSPSVFEVGGWMAMRNRSSPTPAKDRDSDDELAQPSLKRKAKSSLPAARPAKTARISLGNTNISHSSTRSFPPLAPKRQSFSSTLEISRARAVLSNSASSSQPKLSSRSSLSKNDELVGSSTQLNPVSRDSLTSQLKPSTADTFTPAARSQLDDSRIDKQNFSAVKPTTQVGYPVASSSKGISNGFSSIRSIMRGKGKGKARVADKDSSPSSDSLPDPSDLVGLIHAQPKVKMKLTQQNHMDEEKPLGKIGNKDSQVTDKASKEIGKVQTNSASMIDDEEVIQISSDSEVAEQLASDASKRFSNLSMNKDGVYDLTMDETPLQSEDDNSRDGEGKATGKGKEREILNQASVSKILSPSLTSHPKISLNASHFSTSSVAKTRRSTSGVHIDAADFSDRLDRLQSSPKYNSSYRGVDQTLPKLSAKCKSSHRKPHSAKATPIGSRVTDRSLSDTICISLGGAPAAGSPSGPRYEFPKPKMAMKPQTVRLQNGVKSAPLPANAEVIDLCASDEDEMYIDTMHGPDLALLDDPSAEPLRKGEVPMYPSPPLHLRPSNGSNDLQLNDSISAMPSSSIGNNNRKSSTSSCEHLGGRRDLQLVAAAIRLNNMSSSTQPVTLSSQPRPSTTSPSFLRNKPGILQVATSQGSKIGLSSSNPPSPQQDKKLSQSLSPKSMDPGNTLYRTSGSGPRLANNSSRCSSEDLVGPVAELHLNTFEDTDSAINEVQRAEKNASPVEKGILSNNSVATTFNEAQSSLSSAVMDVSLNNAPREASGRSSPRAWKITHIDDRSDMAMDDVRSTDRSSNSKTPEIYNPVTPNASSGRRIGAVNKPDFSKLQDVISDLSVEDDRSLATAIKWPAERVPTELHDMINRLPKNYLFNPQMKHIFESMMEENTADDEPVAPRIEIRGRKDDQVTPYWEFYYTNRIFYGQGVPRSNRKTLKGCDCIGPCNPKSKTCACVKRQMAWAGSDKNVKGFLYNKNGRLVDHHYPVFECNDECECSENCTNRVIQHGRKHAISITLTSNKGWGVFADEKIPRGTYLGIYSGEMILESEADERGKLYDKFGRTYLFDMDFYFLHSLADGQQKASGTGCASSDAGKNDQVVSTYTIDAFHVGNFTRFLNHSCDPNCKITATYVNESDLHKPTLTIYTCRDVRAGEELTFAYFGADEEDEEEEDEVDEHDQKKIKVVGGPLTHNKKQAVYRPCLCGSANCRGQMF